MFLPKCPLCFAAYGSAIGALGIGPAVHQRLAGVLLALALTLSVGLVLALSLLTTACGAPSPGTYETTRKPVWTLSGLAEPESVALGEGGRVLYVANVNSVRCRRWESARAVGAASALSKAAISIGGWLGRGFEP